MAYETATGETIDQAKKDIATQEVVVTRDLAKDIGNVQAKYVIKLQRKTPMLALVM